jgi:hypothetical protein
VGRTPTSARAGEPIPGGDMDGYDNLILLCASDHRLIDSQPGRFATATVCELKRAHERWVEQSLEVSVRAQSETVQLRLTHARTGKELIDAVAGYDALQFDYCEPHDADEDEAIAEFSGELHDCDTISELGGAERVRVASRMSELLWRLGEHGMLAWWGHLTRRWPTPAGPMPYRLAVVEGTPDGTGPRAHRGPPAGHLRRAAEARMVDGADRGPAGRCRYPPHA